jgi:hypothetical protein
MITKIEQNAAWRAGMSKGTDAIITGIEHDINGKWMVTESICVVDLLPLPCTGGKVEFVATNKWEKRTFEVNEERAQGIIKELQRQSVVRD